MGTSHDTLLYESSSALIVPWAHWCLKPPGKTDLGDSECWSSPEGPGGARGQLSYPGLWKAAHRGKKAAGNAAGAICFASQPRFRRVSLLPVLGA